MSASRERTPPLGDPIKAEKLHRVFQDCWSRREFETRLALKEGETVFNLVDLGISLIELYLQEPPPQQIVAIDRLS